MMYPYNDKEGTQILQTMVWFLKNPNAHMVHRLPILYPYFLNLLYYAFLNVWYILILSLYPRKTSNHFVEVNGDTNK